MTGSATRSDQLSGSSQECADSRVDASDHALGEARVDALERDERLDRGRRDLARGDPGMQSLRELEQLQALRDALLRDAEALCDALLRQPRGAQALVAGRLLQRVEVLTSEVLSHGQLQAAGALVDVDDMDRHLELAGHELAAPPALWRHHDHDT